MTTVFIITSIMTNSMTGKVIMAAKLKDPNKKSPQQGNIEGAAN
jgi:hypothetical protein